MEALAGSFDIDGYATCCVRSYTSFTDLWGTVQDLEFNLVVLLEHIKLLGDAALDTAWLMALNATADFSRLDLKAQNWKKIALVFGENEAAAWAVLTSSIFWCTAEPAEPDERHCWCAVTDVFLLELRGCMPALDECREQRLAPGVARELGCYLPAALTPIVQCFLWAPRTALNRFSDLHSLQCGNLAPEPSPADPARCRVIKLAIPYPRA
jgi:hypothetical protein